MLQTGLTRFYLRNPELRTDLRLRVEEVFAETPTFEALDISQMQDGYQVEYHAGVSAAIATGHQLNLPTIAPRTTLKNLSDHAIKFGEEANPIVEWIPASGGTEAHREPTMKSVLKFTIYYLLSKRDIRWNDDIQSGCNLFSKTDFNDDFALYELPVKYKAKPEFSFAEYVGDAQWPPPRPYEGAQFQYYQQTQEFYEKYGQIKNLVCIERPRGHYNFLVFHVVRFHISKLLRKKIHINKYSNEEMFNLLRKEATRNRFFAKLRERILKLGSAHDVIREDFFVFILEIGIYSVQCFGQQVYSLIEMLLQEVVNIFEECIEKNLRECYWVRF